MVKNNIANKLIPCLLGFVLSSCSSNAPISRSFYLLVQNQLDAKNNTYSLQLGSYCKGNDNSLVSCGDSNWEKGGPTYGFIGFFCEGKSNGIEILFNAKKSIFPQQLTELQLGYLYKSCGVDNTLILEAQHKEHEMGTYRSLPIVYSNPDKSLSNSKIVLKSPYFVDFQKMYETHVTNEENAKIAADNEKKLKDAAQAQRNKERIITIKKSWMTKKYNRQVLQYSKKDNLLVTAFMGFMPWFQAANNCQNQSMRLPSLDEAISLIENGLCPMALDNCNIPIWTNTSRQNDKDPQRNMIVGNGVWGVLNGQGFPEKLTSELGVICVK